MREIYIDDYCTEAELLNTAEPCNPFDFGHLTGIEYTTIKVWSSIGARSLEEILTFRKYHCMLFPGRMRARCEHQLAPRP